MMTRKHYEAAAAIIRENTVPNDVADSFDKIRNEGVLLVASDLADMFAADNSRFDRSRFMAACTP